jgi:hypothetical protein
MPGVTMATALVDIESEQAAMQVNRCDPYATKSGRSKRPVRDFQSLTGVHTPTEILHTRNH